MRFGTHFAHRPRLICTKDQLKQSNKKNVISHFYCIAIVHIDSVDAPGVILKFVPFISFIQEHFNEIR